MKPGKYFPKAFLPFGLLIHFNAIAQLNAGDSSYYAEAIAYVRSVYVHNIGIQAAWINGRNNVPYNFQFEKGSAYFGSDKFQQGVLTYEGIDYPGIPLLYDEITSTLITQVPQGRLELISRKVDGFSIAGHRFVRVADDKITAGFYEQLYAGKTWVLKKNKKQIKEELVSGLGVLHSVEEKLVYYIKRSGSYYSVNGRKTLLKAFNDHRDELQQLIKKNKLNWKKDADRMLVEVASYYDQLTR